ncbi:MAG: hypothetical protein IJZ13_03225 [Clostridia bacterium]|nr:hypothetical protein [Clostridia bacterium]
MADKGIFRSAMGGFNKKEVLEYIDQITAAWDAERQSLEHQAAAAEARAEAAETAAAEAGAAAETAETAAAEAQAELTTCREQLTQSAAELDTKTVTVQALEEVLQEKEAQLTVALQEIDRLTAQRDEAISAVAEAREQIAALETVSGETATRLEEATHRLTETEATAAILRQENDRYKAVLGTAETAQEHVDSIVRPFIEQANRQADETLDAVQAVLAGVLAQLGELQGSVEQRRQALHRCKADSDSRLSAAFGDWLALARSAAKPAEQAPADPAADSGHFFR